MKARLLVATLVLVFGMSAGYTAFGSTIPECQDLIYDLRTDTDQFVFKNPKDETAQLGKLDGASSKLSLGKFADAVQKLTDYRDKVSTLNVQGKISSPPPPSTLTAQDLINEANQAIVCIQGI
jgi:hypothetical protein